MHNELLSVCETEEEKDALIRALRGGGLRILEALYKLLEKEIEINALWETSDAAYDNPNWAYRQAHINGKRSLAKKLMTIIKKAGDLKQYE